MRHRNALVLCTLLALACEKQGETTPPEPESGVAGDDDGEDIEEEEKPEPDRPVPVEQVLEIDGKLPKEAIDKLLQDHLNEIRACFDETMQHPDGLQLKGAYVIRFAVSKEGKATSAVVELDEVGHKPTGSCLAHVVETFDFGKQKAESTVRLPFYMNQF